MAEIVGIVASLVGPVLELGKCIVVPIKRQFGYLCCFNGHIKSLTDEAKKLEDARVELQKRVDEAEGNGEEIFPQVKTWLISANNEIQVNKSAIEIEIPKVQSGCSTIISRYSLSKKAEKTTETMKELRDDYDYKKFNDNISFPASPAATKSIPVEPGEFESRKEIEEEIMAALRSKEVNVIGIGGMGGIGKTTMAKRIMNRVLKEKIFDEAAITVVGQQEDTDQAMLKIQREISESLKLELDVTTLVPRANALRRRLKGAKRSLIVVDDIWKEFKLEDIGIPCESGDERYCTILLTSRDKDVLEGMKAQKVYAIQTLSEMEALSLFMNKSELCSDDFNLHSLAQDIAKECKGLPIALVTIGGALNKKKLPIWKDALQQLKDANPEGVPGVLEKVYKPLRLSYDLLGCKDAKFLFLLCCLFPEDSRISLRDLTLFCMGLHIFEGTGNLELVRNRVVTMVEMLKSCSLLLDVPFFDEVRMHDVVRDVANFIASRKGLFDGNPGHNSYSKCKWISFFPQKGDELPKTLSRNFPNLHILMIHCPWFERIITRDFSFLQGLNELSVLSFERFAFKSMSITMPLLENLRALHLVECTLEDISVVGKLLTLEILSCCRCDGIKELPTEIGRLDRLKLLEFRDCCHLTKVPPGVLSNLIELEELTIVRSFNGWESAKAKEKGSGNVNVSLHELQSLCKLTCLNIEIEDYTLAAEDINLPLKIVRYGITLGRSDDFNFELGFFSDGGCFEKTLMVNLPSPMTVGNWIRKLARSSDNLWLRYDVLQAPNVKSLEFQNFLKHLMDTSTAYNFTILKKDLLLQNLPNIEEIFNGQIPQGSNFSKNLQRIELDKLPVLKHVWRNSDQDVSLSNNLRTVDIYNCGSLLNLFPPLEMTMAMDSFLQLERLVIMNCGMMDEVFLIKETEKHEEITSHLTFPQLKQLTLSSLESLTNFSKGIESIEFPALTNMTIDDCPKLISLVSSSMGSHQNSASGQDDDSIHLFCKVKFGSLKTLKIGGYNNLSNVWCHQIPDSFFTGLRKLEIVECDSIRSLCSYSIARNLVNLEDLKIKSCKEMVKMIEDEAKIIKETNSPLLLFPHLQRLCLEYLPKLGSFCQWRCNIELPMLKTLRIDQCPIIKVFSMESFISAPKLECLYCSEFSITCREPDDDDRAFRYCFCFWEKHLLLRGLPNIEELCNGPILQGSNFFKNLQRIKISNLPVLKHMWTNSNQDVSLSNNLRAVNISYCGSLLNLFPPLEMTMAHDGFSQLEALTITDCGMMDEVFVIKEREKHEEITGHLTFPELKNLMLRNLGNLTIFSKGFESIEFPALTDMEITGCPKLISLVSSSMGNHQNSASDQDDDSIHLLCKVKFGSLKTLKIGGYNNLSNVWCHQIPDSFFTGLRKLEIVECDSIRSLCSYSIARNLVNLKDLEISGCKEMVKVIEDEIIRETNCPLLLFPSLQGLHLDSLPKLGSFCQWRCDIKLPVFNTLCIDRCPIIKVFTKESFISAHKLEIRHCSVLTRTSSTIRPDGHDDDTFHLFCNLEVTSDLLKRLTISDCSDISSIWCHQISNSFFIGLDQISIYGCDNIRSLFSYSIARYLVNLKNLAIRDCKEMVKLIEDEEEITRDTNCPLLLFPSLQELNLHRLPKLGSFCEWRCDIELPVLNRMFITKCPMMIFTMRSSIRTPKLVGIFMDGQWLKVGDLNEVMKLHNHIEGGEIVTAETV